MSEEKQTNTRVFIVTITGDAALSAPELSWFQAQYEPASGSINLSVPQEDGDGNVVVKVAEVVSEEAADFVSNYLDDGELVTLGERRFESNQESYYADGYNTDGSGDGDGDGDGSSDEDDDYGDTGDEAPEDEEFDFEDDEETDDDGVGDGGDDPDADAESQD